MLSEMSKIQNLIDGVVNNFVIWFAFTDLPLKQRRVAIAEKES